MKNHKDNYMVKDENNILINRIVAIAILSIALLLGYWGFCKYRSTTNKMKAELIEIGNDTSSHEEADKIPDKSVLILGRWKDEYSEIEYFEDGTFMLNTDTGEYKKKAGKWTINRDILALRFYIHPKTHTYKILELSTSAYKIVGISVDMKTYNAIRIKPFYTEGKEYKRDGKDFEESEKVSNLAQVPQRELDKRNIRDEPEVSSIKPQFEREQEVLSSETEPEDGKEEFVDTDKIKTKIKTIQRKLDDLRERYENTAETLSRLNMETDSSDIADLEIERRKMAQDIKENNIQKKQLLAELTVRGRVGWREDENWSTHKEPIEKVSVSIHKTPTLDKQSVNNFAVNKHQQSTAGDNYANVTQVKLRSSPSRGLSKDDVKEMLGWYNFYDSVWNKGGDFTNNYEAQVINGDKVVIDHATGLMWHQSGSLQKMNWGETYQWISELNRQEYAGYRNWRLPTIDEAVTLLESSKFGGENGLYIDSIFDSRQKLIWTSDEKAKTEKMRLGKFNLGKSTSSSRHWWCVNYASGTVSWLIKLIELNKHVRPVHTMR